MARVGLIFGGRSVEHRVSINSARTVGRALFDAGHRVIALGLAPDGCWVEPRQARAALQGSIDAFEPVGQPIGRTLRHVLDADLEVVFPVVHGTWGEDGCLQGFCEMLDLPYVGTAVAASAVAMDKLLTKSVLRDHALPVVEGELVTRREAEEAPKTMLERLDALPLPLFVKPSVGGSSVGVTKVERREDLLSAIDEGLRFDDRLLVERGVSGRELECAVLGYREIEASVIGEIIPGKAFYDYADKYLEEGARLIAPAELADPVADRLRQLAVEAFAAIGGSGMARVDFLLEGDRPHINEINTLPGFTEISMYPRLWALSGLPLPELVDRLVDLALERHADRRRLDAGIKSWVDALG